jgi:muramoyltetrapeptide carboxypeptidase
MLDLLDHDAIGRAGAKALVGFSDLTALHQSLAARIGLATVHGPVVTSLGGGDEESREHLRRLLFEPAAGPILDRMLTVVPGAAEGVLVGGNLALLTSSVGTRDARPAADSVVLLEDVGEDAYRVDQAWPATSGGQVAVVVERLAPLGVPMVTGAPVGHQPHNLAVPLGVPARLDATRGTLALLVPPLV